MTTTTRTQTDREFVISHVDYMVPNAARKLTQAQEWTLYCMADGFGRQTPAALQRINGGYDWSHFRDSSEAAFREMAFAIRSWLALPQTMAEHPVHRAQNALAHLKGVQDRFEWNPSAENFAAQVKAMIEYQEIIKR